MIPVYAKLAPISESMPVYENISGSRHTDVEGNEDFLQEESLKAQPNQRTDEMQLLLSKLNALQQEVQALRGELELQQKKLSLLSDNKLPKKTDDSQDKTLEQQLKHTQVKGLELETTREADLSDEQESYKSAFELVKNRQYSDALLALKDFINEHPNSPLSANAHYWLGELYLLDHNYQSALKQFDTVLHDFPKSSKNASALYKLGMTYGYLGEKQKAQEKLAEVAKHYPNTAASRLAESKLTDYS